ncbi:hypothetical protein D9619_010663 [Psilocybe cf. subviscida]|uniref:NAD(P)-binding domain-containing protein n=1 Tax=Psilocybe cf. subviscida TaxID=2480587 RepID=A0A8H5BA71_9AGAR|nr:hypothetical protein D9619_010663 [Psilocybe cf. subviscida]
MTTLITGGTGKTGQVLAKLLTDAGHPVLLTSRKGEAPAPFKAVKFDWFDRSSFETPFEADPNIDRIYLVLPPGLNPGPTTKPFIDLAIAKGVKRFVLLGGSTQTSESPSTGQVQKLLEESDVDYAVLKATWFQENFGTLFLFGIREKDAILSSMGDGLAPFVSTHDIAQAAFDCLTVDKLGKQEITLLGPELLTYDDAAKMLTSILGREITHKRLSSEQMTGILASVGLPEDLAAFLVSLEQATADGVDSELFKNDDPKKRIGKHSLLEYLKENRELWVKA